MSLPSPGWKIKTSQTLLLKPLVMSFPEVAILGIRCCLSQNTSWCLCHAQNVTLNIHSLLPVFRTLKRFCLAYILLQLSSPSYHICEVRPCWHVSPAWYPTLRAHPKSFIHSPINRHLGCFKHSLPLRILSSTALHIPSWAHLQKFLGHVPVDRYSKAGLQDICTLLDTVKLLSKVALQFTLHNKIFLLVYILNCY